MVGSTALLVDTLIERYIDVDTKQYKFTIRSMKYEINRINVKKNQRINL